MQILGVNYLGASLRGIKMNLILTRSKSLEELDLEEIKRTKFIIDSRAE